MSLARTFTSTQRLALALALCSGVASLVYEVVWARMLALLLGHTAVSHAVVLSTFLGGLAIGYGTLGRVAERLRLGAAGRARSLQAYALLEGAVGVYGLLFPSLLQLVSGRFLVLARGLGADSTAILPTSIAAAALLLLPPTVMMGGTLPFLIGALSPPASPTRGTRDEIAVATAWAYAVNSAGAVLGSLLAGFFLVETLGYRGSLGVASAIDLLVAVVGVTWARSRPLDAPHLPVLDAPPLAPAKVRAAARAPALSAASAPTASLPRALPLAIAATAGLAGLVVEVVWMRLFGLFFGSATQSFTIVVAAYIAGITVGSAFVGKALSAGADGRRLLLRAGLLGAATVLASRCVAPLVPWVAGALRVHFAPLAATTNGTLDLDAAFRGYQASRFFVAAALLLGPSLVGGMILPLCARLGGEAGRPLRVGTVLAWNTAGCVLAAAGTSALLVPWIGLRGCLLVAAGGYGAVSLALLLAARGPHSLSRAGALVVIFAVAAVGAERLSPWDPLRLSAGEFRRDREADSLGAWLDEPNGGVHVVQYEEGPTTTVATFADEQGAHWMMLDGKSDASEIDDSLTQLGLGVFGAIAADQPRDALVIGFGSGATAAVIAGTGINVDVVEIEPAVLRAAPFFSRLNGGVQNSERLHVHVADARAWLAAAPDSRRWDAVVSEPSNPWVAGVASLYTREFFRSVRAHLRPGGALVQWFHVYDMDDASLQLILRTVAESFPWVSVWLLGPDVVLVAREAPGVFDDLGALDHRIDAPPIRAALQRAGVVGMSAFSSLALAGNERLRAALAGVPGPIHVDDLPRLEHALPRAQFARQEARWLATFDGRRPSQPGDKASGNPGEQLPWARWTAAHPTSTDEKLAFTMLQARQSGAPAAFRFQFLDEILGSETDPWVLRSIVVGLQGTGNEPELERAREALRRHPVPDAGP